jgi:protein-disulfide isomerase
MKSNLAIGAAIAGAALLGALAVAYSNAQPGKGGQSVKAGAPTTAAFDSAQEEAIRTIVRAYLTEHPEVLVDALNGYEEKQRIAQEAAMLENAQKNLTILASAEHGFVAGADPAAADVVVIELFDYHCSFCKRAMGTVRDLTRNDKRVKVVFRELPILREESDYAAKAALAAREQGKYAELHFAMMEATGVLTKERIEEIAKKAGLDVARLKADAEKPGVKTALAETERIARDMEVDGTPTFIIASVDGGFVEVIPGFRAEALNEAISKAKKAAKKK